MLEATNKKKTRSAEARRLIIAARPLKRPTNLGTSREGCDFFTMESSQINYLINLKQKEECCANLHKIFGVVTDNKGTVSVVVVVTNNSLFLCCL